MWVKNRIILSSISKCELEIECPGAFVADTCTQLLIDVSGVKTHLSHKQRQRYMSKRPQFPLTIKNHFWFFLLLQFFREAITNLATDNAMTKSYA